MGNDVYNVDMDRKYMGKNAQDVYMDRNYFYLPTALAKNDLN